MSKKHSAKKERPVPGTDEYYTDPRKPIWYLLASSLLPLLLFGVGVFLLWSAIDAGIGAESTEGIVVDFKWHRDHNDRTYERAVVRYSVDGHSYRCEGVWMSGWYLPYSNGSRVRVLYKIDDPSNAVIDNFTERWVGGLIFFVVGVAVFAAFMRFLLRQIQNKLAAARNAKRQQSKAS
jgi:hypothetical protein